MIYVFLNRDITLFILMKKQEFRSVNARIEFLLRDAARREGRLKKEKKKTDD
jgi:hypothetical protein